MPQPRGSSIERFGSWFTAHVGPRYEVGNVADSRKTFWTVRGVLKFTREMRRMGVEPLRCFQWTGREWREIG